MNHAAVATGVGHQSFPRPWDHAALETYSTNN